jgi:hypothetical protein
MIRLGKFSLLLLFVCGGVFFRTAASEPSFNEIYDLIRTNSVLSESQLNRAAIEGLLNELRPKAVLVTNSDEPRATADAPFVTKSFILDGEIGYLRIVSVADGLADQVRSAWQKLGATNKLKGAIVDLRFADGTDYSAAAAAAELFPTKKPPTVDWGAGTREVKGGSELISIPAVVLVNGETSAASEALAAMLRNAEACLLLGNSTAGHALVTKDFSLNNGTTLRIATAPVKLNGSDISSVQPDIEIAVSPKDERAFYAGEFLDIPKISDIASMATNKVGTTNLTMRRPRLNEAELVRAHRQGLNPDDIARSLDGRIEPAELTDQPRVNVPATPVIRDPVLSRAVDLLKGLAIVRQSNNVGASR